MTQWTGNRDQPLVLTAVQARPLATRLADYAQIAKPRLTLMVVVTAFIGAGVAIRTGGSSWSLGTMLATLAGTALSCVGAGAFNQILERRSDGLMRRTMNRPLPAGRMTSAEVGVFAGLCCVTGVGCLAVLTTPLAALLAGVTVISYVLLYTPLKRISSISTIVGAVPGALPPVLGYAAVTGWVDERAWMMFAIMFLWQLPHFLAIAWLYREDYARAGMPMLPVLDPQGGSTFRQIMLGCLTLLPLGLMPTIIGMSGGLYFVGAVLAGAMFLGFAVALVIGRTRRHARAVFFASLVYLPVVMSLMLIDGR